MNQIQQPSKTLFPLQTITRRLWTPEEDELVRTLIAVEAAERTGRTLKAVYLRRFKLGMPDARS